MLFTFYRYLALVTGLGVGADYVCTACDHACSDMIIIFIFIIVLLQCIKPEQSLCSITKETNGSHLNLDCSPWYQLAYSPHCSPYIFYGLMRRICLTINTFSTLWSFPLFSNPLCLVKQCYFKENLDAGDS